MNKTVRDMLPGMEPMTTPKLPAGMEPMLSSHSNVCQNNPDLGFTFRMASGSKHRNYAYMNKIAMEKIGDPEYVIPLFDKSTNTFALKASDASNPYALHITKYSNAGHGKSALCANFKELAAAFEKLIPEWKPYQYKALVFYSGEPIGNAMYFRHYMIVEEQGCPNESMRQGSQSGFPTRK